MSRFSTRIQQRVSESGEAVVRRVANIRLDKTSLDPSPLRATVLFLTGRAWHPPSRAKRNHLIRLIAQRGHRIFVEGGTYRGDTIAFVLPHVDRAISVELSAQYFAAARERFAGVPAVELYLGDATDVIPELVATLDQSALIWLDGHYSGRDTALGNEVEPAAEILERLAADTPSGSTIVIDDLRLFGHADYASLDIMIATARRSFPDAIIRTGLDSLVIEL